jgi:hypothetical protein
MDCRRLRSALTGSLLAAMLLAVTAGPAAAQEDAIDGLIESFQQQFNGLTPRPGSSVNTDYAFRQAALGSYYSTLMLGQLHEQNREAQARSERIIALLERLARQNEEIVRLLRDIRNTAGPAPPAAPGAPQ